MRLKSLDFQDLQNKVRRQIVILENVVFHRTLLDTFIDIFKEHIEQIPIFETAQVFYLCFYILIKTEQKSNFIVLKSEINLEKKKFK